MNALNESKFNDKETMMLLWSFWLLSLLMHSSTGLLSNKSHPLSKLFCVNQGQKAYDLIHPFITSRTLFGARKMKRFAKILFW